MSKDEFDAEWEEPTMTYVRSSQASAEGDEPLDKVGSWLHEEVTRADWAPQTPDLGEEEAPTAAGYVCNPQPWPTVLDTHTLTFLGEQSSLGDADLELADTVSIGAGSRIFSQGHPCELLYCLDSGTVALERERGFVQDLGAVESGSFFGEVGAMMGLPSTTSAVAADQCLLRLVTRDALKRAVRKDKTKATTVIASLRQWYTETVAQVCPLFDDLDQWKAQQERGVWVTFKPGDQMSTEGKFSPLFVIVTGHAKIVVDRGGQEVCLGYLCPGDLAGEVNPSPVTVLAETTVAALRFNRHLLAGFSEPGRKALAEQAKACKKAASISAEG